MKRAIVVCLAGVVAVSIGGSAGATLPGMNGRIAYVSSLQGSDEVFSANADGSDAQRLTWTTGDEQSPAWSPDGTRIAYQLFGGSGGARIWVMNADGTDRHQLSPEPDVAPTSVSDAEPEWSPDGSRVVFSSTRPFGSSWGLWVVNADGSGLQRVAPAYSAIDPAWSPDGGELAYVVGDVIGVSGLDGSAPRRISASGTPAGGPSWSPDGRQIVFSRADATGWAGDLFVANSDGTGERQLTHDGQGDALPSWSPDGTQIAFQHRTRSDYTAQLYVVGSDGSNEHALPFGGRTPAWGPAAAAPPASPDAPTIDIASPAAVPGYLQNEQVRAFYMCESAVSVVVSCTGDVPFGERVDTSAGVHVFTVRATDLEGRTAVRSVRYHVVDTVPPEIELRTPVDGGRYALNSKVDVDYSCSDPNGSGIVFCLGDRPAGTRLDTSQLGPHTFTVHAGDDAYHITTKTVTYTVVASPVVSIASPTDGARYALNSVVVADYACKDLVGNGIASCVGDRPAGTPLDTSSPGAHAFTVNALDNAANSSTKTVTYSVVAPPQVIITSPVDGASYTLGANLIAQFSCSSHDVSVLTCIGDTPNGTALDTSTVGLKGFTVAATDTLAQTTSRTAGYRVTFPFAGFDSPVSADGVVDGAKAGQGVPLKFSLGGDRGNGVVTAVSWQQVSCSDGTKTGVAEAGTGKLSYTSSTNRYLEVVSTDPSWKGTCRTLSIQLADTTVNRVTVRFAH